MTLLAGRAEDGTGSWIPQLGTGDLSVRGHAATASDVATTRSIYANNAGTSWPKAPGVAQAARAALEAEPSAGRHAIEQAQDELAAFLGIEDKEGLLLTPGCTSALSIALSELSLHEGDVVLTSALEHHALLRPVEHLVRSRGIVHEVAPYAPGEPVDLDHVRHVLKGGRTRLIACTAASNVTGELLPVAELLSLAHEYGALLLLDAAQTAGVVRLRIDELPVDLLTLAGHKGLLGPLGIGVLWAAPHVTFDSSGATCDIDAAACAGSRAAPGYCDAGSVNTVAAAGLAAALRWQREHAGSVGEHARALCARLRARLRERAGCQVLGGEHNAHTGALSLRIEALPLAHSERFFAERGISVRAGQHCAASALAAIGAPEGALRISLGPFNRDEDVDRILEVIDQAIESA